MKHPSLYFILLLLIISCKKEDSSIVAHWTLDNNVKDQSTYQLNGQIHGNPKFVNSLIEGKALDFNGDDFIEIDIKNQNSQHIKTLSKGSISLWFKARSWDVENSILPIFYYGGEEACEEEISGDNTGMVIQLGHGGMFPSKSLYFTHFDKACSIPALCFNTNSKTEIIETEKWYHFVGVVGENYNTGYINGKELSNRSYNFNANTSAVFFKDYLSHEKLWIGKSIWMGKEAYFDGLIDDVRIYNKPLNTEEIKELYNSKIQ